MNEKPNFRLERIGRLLDELRYEISRGVMEREIDETMGYRFVIPVSSVLKGGVVACQFSMRPMPSYSIGPDDPREPRFKVVRNADVS